MAAITPSSTHTMSAPMAVLAWLLPDLGWEGWSGTAALTKQLCRARQATVLGVGLVYLSARFFFFSPACRKKPQKYQKKKKKERNLRTHNSAVKLSCPGRYFATGSRLATTQNSQYFKMSKEARTLFLIMLYPPLLNYSESIEVHISE